MYEEIVAFRLLSRHVWFIESHQLCFGLSFAITSSVAFHQRSLLR